MPSQVFQQDLLDRECTVFGQYLLQSAPDRYVMRKYSDAHAVMAVFTDAPLFDRCLLSFARVSPRFTRCADAYARWFAADSLLRRKLVLLLAILETCPPTYRLIDQPISGSVPGALARITINVCTWALSFVAGSVIFLPLRLLTAGGPRKRR